VLEQQVKRHFSNLQQDQKGDGYASKSEQQENTGTSQIQQDWRAKERERIRSFRSGMTENEKEGLNEERSLKKAQTCQEINEERRLKRAKVSEEEHKHINE
jgi:hypothetical protein